MLLRPIPRNTNVVVGWGSHMYGRQVAEDEEAVGTGTGEGSKSKQVSEGSLQEYDREEAHWTQVTAEVHSGRRPHPSAKQTWSKFNKYFEGHHILLKPFKISVKNA